MVRPTDGVKRLFKDILQLQLKQNDLMDGDAMVQSFNLNRTCQHLSSAPLDRALFPCGKVFHHDQFPQRMGVRPLVYHANFMIGLNQKKSSFQQHSMWYI